MTSKTHEHSAQIYNMMARLGIAQDEVDPLKLSLWFETALSRCENCSAKKACQDWLNCVLSAASVAPWFCVNADILFELRYDQPGPRRVN